MDIVWKMKIPVRLPDDRRQADRVYLKAKISCHIGPSKLTTHCQDISVTGLRIETPGPVPPGSCVDIELISPFNQKKIHFTSEIVWCKNIDGRFFAGLRHLKIAPGDIADFYELLAYAMLNFLFSVNDGEKQCNS